MKIKINLFRKIFLFSIFLVIFTVVLSYFLSIFVSDTFYISRKKEEIREIATTTKKLMLDRDILADYIDDIKNSQGIDIYLSNNSYYDSYYDIEYNNNYDEIEDGFHINNIGQNHIMILIYKEKLSDNLTLFISTSLSVMSSHRHEVYLLNIFTLIISLGLGILISRLFAKNITNNIFELNRVAKKITDLDFSERSNVNTSDELSELSENINIMANSLSSSINNLKSFVSNASHELKTPITVINSHAQILLKGSLKNEEDKKRYYRAILKESKSMNDLVQDLLLLSKLSALDIKFDIKELDLTSLIKESIEKYEFLELQKDINWEISLEKIEILANEKFLQIALNNIIQNALKYAPSNSILRIYQKENSIIFENPTQLIETKSVDNLFQPFFRGDNANELNIDGHGLGLSLIKKILDLHKFTYDIKIEKDLFIFTLTYSSHNLKV